MKKTTTLGYMTWKRGQWCAYQMLRLFKWGLTNYGIALETTLMNTSWPIEEREWELDEFANGVGPMCGVAMKTYIWDVDTKKERRTVDRTGTCQHVSVRGSPEEEETQWAVVWMQFQWRKLISVTQLKLCQKWCGVQGLWRVGSWGNMNWVRVRNIKWEDGTHVLRARRRMKRKLTKWRISTIVCSTST